MRGLVRAILAALLVLTLGVTGVAAANDTADTAQVVSADNPSVGGTLVGSTGGAFRYYRFDYSGAGAAVKIHLTWNPGWQSTGPAFGFNVYGPGGDSNGLVGQGVRGDDAGSASTANLTLAASSPGSYLVQVYSYTDATSQDFTLDFTGLGAATKPVAANVTPEKAVEVRDQSVTMAGSLTGHSSGAYNFFNLDYPGGNWAMSISLSFSPASALSSNAFGFNVYDGDNLVATGGEVSRTGETATKTATITRIAPGPFLLQVYNYAEGVTGTYAVGVSGGAGAIATVADNGTPDKAFRLTPQVPAGRGAIAGNSAGAFGYYWIDYQGNNEVITISMPFKPGPGLVGNGIGFNLYRGSDLVGASTIAYGRNPQEGVAYLTYGSDQPGPYGIQVYNYVPGTTADYTLYVLALKR